MNTKTLQSASWSKLAQRHPSAFLLAAQLVSLVLYAFLDGSPNGRAYLGAFGVLVLMLTVWVVRRSPGLNWVASVLVVPAVVLSLFSVFFVNPALLIWASLFEAALYFYAAGSMVAYMMEDYRVTLDELYAAGSTFTLLAWGFTHTFIICQTLIPESFVGMIHSGEPRSFIELMALSFSNLTATGLGDVLPIKPLARVLAMLEQLVGIGYLAIVVSRLIGMTFLQKEKEG